MQLVFVYLLLAAAGAVLPLSQFLPWLLEHGLDPQLFFQDLFSNRIGGFFGWDVIVSAIVLIVFVSIDGQRNRIRQKWIPILGCLTIGVSFGLPVYLAMRELRLRNI